MGGAFEKLYGLKFSRFYKQTLRAPISPVQTANMAATMRTMIPWKEMLKCNCYLNLCNDLLIQWESSIHEGNEASVQVDAAIYDRIETWYKSISATYYK
jgi:hypothetical protein